MKYFITLKHAALLALFMLLHIGVNGQTAPNDVQEGVVRIKFKRQVSATLSKMQVSPQAGTLSSGITTLDKANKILRAASMKRVFPYSAKNDAKHRKHGLDLWYDVFIDNSISPMAAIETYKSVAGDNIDVAEPIYIKKLIDGDAKPYNQFKASESPLPFNDRLLGSQWHYNNTGQVPGAIPEADINLFEAWKVQTGRPEVIVCIVDGGIDINHNDLKDNLWVNMAELNGKPGVDDDNNGYIDDIYGVNFINGNGDITPHHHGTHVAGTVAATNNNGLGVCGVAGGSGKKDGVRLISAQVFSESGSSGGFAPAIVYGADNGAVISQNSWGYRQPNIVEQSVLDAIDYFIEEAGHYPGSPMKGGIVIFAAGNDNVDDKMYPGYYEKTLCVSALGPDNKKAYYSNYGTWVDIAAPGGDQNNGETSGVLSTLPGNTYGYLQGTSMACPHVSGIAALAVSQFGAPDFTADELRIYLERSTHDVDKYNPDYKGKLGIGYIDAALALKRNEGAAPDQVNDLKLTGISQDFASLEWTIPQDKDDDYPSNFQIFYHTAPITPENYLEAQIVSVNNNQPAGTVMKYDLNGLKPLTTYYFAIRSMDRWANKSALSNVVSATTNVGPDINIPVSGLTMTANKAGGFKSSSIFSIENLDEGTLKWEGIMRHRTHQLSNTSKEITYPKPSATTGNFKCNIAARHTNNLVQTLDKITLNDTEEQIKYGDGTIYVIGESDGTFTTSSAVRYQVTNTAGFNLTHVAMILNHNPATENVVMEVYKDVLKPGNLIYAQEVTSYTYAVYDHTVQLNEQLYFANNEVFWIVFHVPQGNPYALGAQTETAASNSDNCFMSLDLGKSWMPLSALIKDTYVWSTRAISRNRYLGEYLELSPSNGHITGKANQDVTVSADASKLINGKYQANLVIASNDPDEKEVRLPVTLTVTEQMPSLTNVAVVNYGSVFYGLSKDLIIPVTNAGYGDFAKLKASTSDDQFKIIKKVNSIPARSISEFTVRYTPNNVGNDNGLLILEDNKGNTHKIRLFGIGTAPAEITVNPQSVALNNLAIGDKPTASFTITNSGQYPLDFKLPLFMMNKLTPKDYSTHKFGYSYESNIDGGVLDYNWVDIRKNGKDMTEYFRYTHSSHNYYNIDLGFEFPFFGRKISKINLTRYGALTLNQEGPLGTCFPPYLDNQCAPAGVISAMMWAFDINRSGSIHYLKQPGKLTIQFTDVFNEEGFEDEKVTFQIILYQNGDIDYLFEDIEMMYPGDLELSLVGIGDPDYKDAFVINGNKYEIGGYTNGHLEANQTIYRIKHPGQNLIESVSKTEGTLGVGESATINVTLNTSSLNEGINNQILSIISNDPHKPVATVKFTANITSGGSPNLTADRDLVDFGTVFRGTKVYQTLDIVNSGNKNIALQSASITGSAFKLANAVYPLEVKAKSAQYFQIEYNTKTFGKHTETLTITAENGQQFTIGVKGEVTAEPMINVDTDEIRETIDAGGLKNHTITITNDGESPLEFIASGTDWLYLNENDKVRTASLPEFMYSYQTTRDEDAPKYEWIDITEEGTIVPQSWFDDNQQFWRAVELPFEFKFYNQPTNKIWFSWQGLITTSTPMINPPWILPGDFPSTLEPNNIIAPYFGLHKYNRPGVENSGVFYKVYNDKVVVMWSNLFDMYGLGNDYSFEAIIFQNGIIKFQYKHTDQGMVVVDKGVIGLENATGTEAVRVAAYQNFIQNGMAITFNPGIKKRVPAQESAEFNIALDATNLNKGIYSNKLTLFNNTPLDSRVEIPVMLKVNGKALLTHPDTIRFGSVMAYTDPATGWEKEYMQEFSVRNDGRALLTFKSIKLDDDSEARLEYYAENRGAFMWMPVPAAFTSWQPCKLNPGETLKLRAYISPTGENEKLSANIVFTSNDLPASVLIPISASVKQPPVANLEGDDITINANTPKHKETRSIILSNAEGKDDLNYDLSLSFTRSEKASLAKQTYRSMTSQADLSSVKAAIKAGLTAISAENYDVVLEYDQAQVPDTYIGLGDGTEFVNATAFSAPATGLKLTHVKTWYRPGKLLDSEIKFFICSGAENLNDAEVLLEQSYTHKIEKEDDKGEFITLKLSKPIVFYPNEKFYVVINYPFDASHPQGAAQMPQPVKGRFFYPYNNTWEDVADSPVSKFGWMVKAMSDKNEVSSWATIASPAQGTVKANETVEIKLDFDAQFSNNVDNFAKLEVKTNDPVNPSLSKAIALHVNQGPSMKLSAGQKLTVNEMETIEIKIEAEDKEGDKCTYELVGANKHVTMKVSDKLITLTYSPDYESAGTTTITLKGTDEYKNSNTLAVNVEVVNVNRKPELKKPFNNLDVILQQKQLKVNLNDYFTDPDGDKITYTASSADNSIVELFLSDNSLILEPRMIAKTTIALTITDQHGATAVHTVNVSVINRVGIDELEANGWSLYPNPADDYVVISKSSDVSANTMVRIYSVAGQNLKQESVNSGSKEARIDVGNLAPGVYFVEINENNHTLTTKLIKK